MTKAASFLSADGLLLDARVSVPVAPASGAVLLVHGITADLDEGGFYAALADRLCADGSTVLRFSFRGHGRSEGSQTGVTIAGEMLDLLAAVDQVRELGHERLAVVAASFGAVALCLVEPVVREAVDAVVLLNPALDLRKTFLEPASEWGRAYFGEAAAASLRAHGHVDVGDFRLGPVFFRELEAYCPLTAFVAMPQPALVIHGDRDSATPYEVSRDAATRKRDCELVTIAGADHGFGDKQAEVIEATARWLAGLGARAAGR